MNMLTVKRTMSNSFFIRADITSRCAKFLLTDNPTYFSESRDSRIDVIVMQIVMINETSALFELWSK